MDKDGVLVYRNPVGQPVAVPDDVVIDAERPYRAYLLRRQGMTWEDIAALEEYPSASAASHDVSVYLNGAAQLVTDRSRQSALLIELGRLDALLNSVWKMAMAGNLAAVNAAHSIVVTRLKTLKLDSVEAVDDQQSIGSSVVIDSNDYTGGLRRASQSG
jgi:hypothetical protein